MSRAPLLRAASRPRLITGVMLTLFACADAHDARPQHTERDAAPGAGAVAVDRDATATVRDATVASMDAGAAADEPPDAHSADASDGSPRAADVMDAAPAVHDASAVLADAEPSGVLDASPRLPDPHPNRADAGIAECDASYVFPCFPAIPDRTSIGELSVSNVPRPFCPETLPIVGEPCNRPGVKCGYGSRARASCRKLFQCWTETWIDLSLNCWLPPPGHCPATQPTTGSACDTHIFPSAILPVCDYGATVTCTCGKRYFRDGSPGWQCNVPPTQAGCPAVAPNHGEGCAAAPGIECAYGPMCQPGGGRWACRDGVWTYVGQHDPCGLD